MNWIALTGETKDVVRDQNGVPIEWTILRLGENPICQEGRDGAIRLTAEGMQQILAYHTKKGEEIPIDSEHYLYELANQKKLDEGETLKLFPGGVAAMGFGSLALAGENLRIRAHGAGRKSKINIIGQVRQNRKMRFPRYSIHNFQSYHGCCDY